MGRMFKPDQCILGYVDPFNKLVQSYMNRFIIDEDAHFEVVHIGHYRKDRQTDFIKAMKNNRGNLQQQAWILIEDFFNESSMVPIDEQPLRDQIIAAINKSQINTLEDDSVETHLIFGSPFGSINLQSNTHQFKLNYFMRFIFSAINKWSLEKIISATSIRPGKHIMVTTFDGFRNCLTREQQFETIRSTQNSRFDFVLERMMSIVYKCVQWMLGFNVNYQDQNKDSFRWFLVGDDMESWLTEIQNGDSDKLTCQYLKTNRMLMSEEARSVKKRDADVLEMFRESLFVTDIPIFDEQDQIYVDEQCFRCSFLIEK